MDHTVFTLQTPLRKHSPDGATTDWRRGRERPRKRWLDFIEDNIATSVVCCWRNLSVPLKIDANEAWRSLLRLTSRTSVSSRKISRNKRKRQPIGMLGRSSGNHDWLLANTSACVSCGFRLRNARNASDCVWMETGLNCSVFKVKQTFPFVRQLLLSVR